MPRVSMARLRKNPDRFPGSFVKIVRVAEPTRPATCFIGGEHPAQGPSPEAPLRRIPRGPDQRGFPLLDDHIIIDHDLARLHRTLQANEGGAPAFRSAVFKHDGYRLMVRRDDGRVRCFTRNGLLERPLPCHRGRRASHQRAFVPDRRRSKDERGFDWALVTAYGTVRANQPNHAHDRLFAWFITWLGR